jgi:hypothetical protein
MTDDEEAYCERLEAALRRVIEWADAYPVEVFPRVTTEYAQKAHEVLTANGMTLDRLSANAMRHCLIGVRLIASTALGDKQESTDG